MGSNALTDTPSGDFRVVEVRMDSSRYLREFNPHITNAYGSSLQLGVAGDYFAFFAARFSPLSVLPDSCYEDSCVDSMAIHFRINLIWRPEGLIVDSIQVVVREITKSWVENDLLPGFFDSLDYYPPCDTVVFDSIGLDSSFSYTVPSSVRQHWLAGDSSYQGLLFKPMSEGVLVDFYSKDWSDSNRMHITIYYRDSAGTAISVEQPLASGDVAGKVQDGYLARDSAHVPAGEFMISKGNARRAALYFPLDSLTSNFADAVVRAQLYLYADTLSTVNLYYKSGSANQFYWFKHGTLSDTIWISDPDTAHAISAYLSSSGSGPTMDSSGTYYVLDVTGAVASWVAGGSKNGGLQIMASDETEALGRQLFYSPASEDSLKRPKLVIWLSESQ